MTIDNQQIKLPQLPPSKEFVQVHTKKGWVVGSPAESLYTADQMYDIFRAGVAVASAAAADELWKF